MANPISNISTPLPAMVERMAGPAASQPNAAVDRQALAEGGNATSVPASSAPAANGPEGSTEQLQQAVIEISSYVQSVSRSLEISVDQELGTTVIQVLDADTDELVRQIPAEETLRIAKFLADQRDDVDSNASALGLLMDREG